MRKVLVWVLITTAMTAVAALPVRAAPPPQAPETVYVVQPGDTLIEIALRFNLNPAELALVNNLPNPDLIYPGQALVLPQPGENQEADRPAVLTHTVRPGDTLFLIAQHYGVPMGTIIQANHLSNPDLIEVGQTLQIPLGPPPDTGPLSPPFEAISLSEPVIIQGRTLVVRVDLSDPTARLSGMFEGRPLFFAPAPDHGYWTIIAIHAMTEPNIYPVVITASLADGSTVEATANVQVIEGPYGVENIQLDETRSALLDETLLEQERQKLVAIWSQVSERPRWEGPFRYPVDGANVRVTSQFGTRRSYNSGPVASFHGGADFGGGVGTPVYAPAAGVVALAEPLTVRGNAVVIDHGMGLFSGYWHLDRSVVSAGQEVQPGDLLGYLGGTGLVTGPHLHWEMRLQGIAVDPLQWVQETIP
ncbi:MAG: LysM peptidoglycan-binding domain-containing protein [Chloroflexi bacterium]|nr:MAG: LysM peptidoglycan-binding domain-containing protein [Chloroflexota bacterium]